VFTKNEPREKYFALDGIGAALIANHLPSRDGAARAAKARGDLPAAIQAYRRLLTFGPDSKWVTVLEPRYVLALARLLEQSGDSRQALQEYERFLTLWKRADPELPELDEARRAVARLRTTSTSG
jgi:tetratricopeptide (TPR) repeat protein